ncbi:MAG: VOC family protein [Sphingomonas sp.]
MIEGRHYQNAYVTRDIDAAVETFVARTGATRVLRHDGEVDVWTPRGEGRALNRLAFIWIDNLQYEFIQPVSGFVDIYRDALPADDALTFHHVCMRVDDWTTFRDKVARENWRVVLEGGGDALRYLYLDARDLVGHYLEYVWMTPERWAQMGGR